MTRDHQHYPGPNQNAARIVRESTAESASPPVDLEAAWAEWSRGIQKVDERGMTLLRAAFEAGFETPLETKGRPDVPFLTPLWDSLGVHRRFPGLGGSHDCMVACVDAVGRPLPRTHYLT